jgi:hypothetical protein
MLILTVWLGLMGLGGLCYPRRPRATGVLFVMAGGFMFIVWATGAIGDAPPVVAVTSAALGLGSLWRFRDPAVRAEHVAEWTRKA